MKNNTDIVVVRNFTDQDVCYLIPEKNIRRNFAPFETKEIEVGELRELYFKSGGRTLLQGYLGVSDQELAQEFGISEDLFTHEYSWTQKDIDRVLLNGSNDELADALDFAPIGIVESIVSRAVALKIPNMDKRKIIQQITDRDISRMIGYRELLEEPVEEKTVTQRRTQISDTKQMGRRVS